MSWTFDNISLVKISTWNRKHRKFYDLLPWNIIYPSMWNGIVNIFVRAGLVATRRCCASTPLWLSVISDASPRPQAQIVFFFFFKRQSLPATVYHCRPIINGKWLYFAYSLSPSHSLFLTAVPGQTPLPLLNNMCRWPFVLQAAGHLLVHTFSQRELRRTKSDRRVADAGKVRFQFCYPSWMRSGDTSWSQMVQVVCKSVGTCRCKIILQILYVRGWL